MRPPSETDSGAAELQQQDDVFTFQHDLNVTELSLVPGLETRATVQSSCGTVATPVATSTASDASIPSPQAGNLDYLDAPGRIYAPLSRLRALWTNSPWRFESSRAQLESRAEARRDHDARRPFVSGLVLAAGGSRRLGQPKQLLPYGTGTLLDHVLATARQGAFDQPLCVLGGGAPDVRERVELDGFTVIENHQFGEGCSSSIAAALTAVDQRADVSC